MSSHSRTVTSFINSIVYSAGAAPQNSLPQLLCLVQSLKSAINAKFYVRAVFYAQEREPNARSDCTGPIAGLKSVYLEMEQRRQSDRFDLGYFSRNKCGASISTRSTLSPRRQLRLCGGLKLDEAPKVAEQIL